MTNRPIIPDFISIVGRPKQQISKVICVLEITNGGSPTVSVFSMEHFDDAVDYFKEKILETIISTTKEELDKAVEERFFDWNEWKILIDEVIVQ